MFNIVFKTLIFLTFQISSIIIIAVQFQSTSKSVKFINNNGFILIPNFFKKLEYIEISSIVSKLKKNYKSEINSLAVNRKGCQIPFNSEPSLLLYEKFFYAPNTIEKIINPTGEINLQQPTKPMIFPLEIREYCLNSYMDMHQDEILFDYPQIEFIYCVENTSDTFTQWVDRSGLLHNDFTPPNSLILVKSGEYGSRHGVTKLRKGSRTIIKGIYTKCNQPNDNYHRALNTYSSSSRSRSSSRRRRSSSRKEKNR